MGGPIVDSIRDEYRRYKALGEGAIAQVSDDQLCSALTSNANSIATIVWHLSGNFRSRFTDFLTTDGEKPDRHRDEEFERRSVSRDEVLAKWNAGWDVVLDAVGALTDADLNRTVTIREQPHRVYEALHRSLAHTSYHVGQIVMLAKHLCADDWRYLSIPPGQSAAYNQNPRNEKPAAHAEAIRGRPA
jgi:uncharacterized damage-inducible protein DinB